ncbi:unnamed protein product [Ectocarpus sp. 4 AP-2014]
MTNLQRKECSTAGCTKTSNYVFGTASTHYSCREHAENGKTDPRRKPVVIPCVSTVASVVDSATEAALLVEPVLPYVTHVEASTTAGVVVQAAKAAYVAKVGSGGVGATPHPQPYGRARWGRGRSTTRVGGGHGGGGRHRVSISSGGREGREETKSFTGLCTDVCGRPCGASIISSE